MKTYVNESGWTERTFGPLQIVHGKIDAAEDWHVLDLFLAGRAGWWEMTFAFRLPGFHCGFRWLDDDREATP